MARTLLLAGVLLAILLLTSLSQHPANAQGVETIEYQENGTDPVAAYTAVDLESADIVWTLAGDDEADFSIENGVLDFKVSPDFEDPVDSGGNNEYIVTVTASDKESGGQMATQVVTVNVLNVDEDGVVKLSSLQPEEIRPLTAMLYDPDGGPDDQLPITVAETVLTNDATWQWARSSDGSTGWTDIKDAESDGYTPVVDDVGNYLRATASYTDGEGADKTAHEVSDKPVRAMPYMNQAPVFTNAEGEELADGVNLDRSVAEDAAPGAPVGDPVSATDASIDVLTYTLSGNDPESFAINRATGQILVGAGINLDYETNRTYSVRVTATDPSNEADFITVIITVTNVDEDPSITFGDSAKDYAENTSITNQVSIYIATDPEDNAGDPKWTLSGADSALLEIDVNGSLTFKASPDYEDAKDARRDNVYNVTVVVTDSAGNTDSQDVTVRVTNVDEAMGS